jgi:MFS family permease
VISVGAASALRYPNFARFWLAQVISGFGDRITVLALAFVTWELTRSALSTAFAVVISTVPYALFGLFGGAIADAVGRRRAMVLCDLIRVGAIGVIPILLAIGAPLPVIYVLVFGAAVCSAIFSPARMAIVPDIVPAQGLGAGNSMVYASDRAVEIVGTLLAGVLVALTREAAFYVDAASFALSAWLLSRIAITEIPPRSLSWRGLAADAREGLAALLGDVRLRANTVISLLAQLSLPVLNGLTPVLIFREYRLGPEQYGASEAAIALGAVGASVAAPMMFSRMRKGRLILLGFASFGAVLVAFASSPPFPVLLVLFVLVGVTNVAFFVPNMTLIQEVAPQHLRAGVFGARIALLNLTWIPVILWSASVAESTSVHLLIAGAGFVTIGMALIGSFFRSVRDVP